jgi:hypothetical protein
MAALSRLFASLMADEEFMRFAGAALTSDADSGA